MDISKHLTSVAQHCTILLLRNTYTKDEHEHGKDGGFTQVSRLDGTHAHPSQVEVRVCLQETWGKGETSLYCSSIKSGADDRRQSTSKTQIALTKAKNVKRPLSISSAKLFDNDPRKRVQVMKTCTYIPFAHIVSSKLTRCQVRNGGKCVVL